MEINLHQLLTRIAAVLDNSNICATGGRHGKRVACLSLAVGQQLNMRHEELFILATCALLHGNPLSQSILLEQLGLPQKQVNASLAPQGCEVFFRHSLTYRRDSLWGTDNIPLISAIVGLAGCIDSRAHLNTLPVKQLPALKELIAGKKGDDYTKIVVPALLQALDDNLLKKMRNATIGKHWAACLPTGGTFISYKTTTWFAATMAKVIDSEPQSLRGHSLQVANKAWWMSRCYGLEPHLRAKIYLAAALHDLGKLKVSSAILKKQGPLTGEEFELIQNHVVWTFDTLNEVEGLGEICT